MKYLGLDWGLHKIGLAVSEGKLASPWCSLNVQKNSFYKKITKIVIIAKEKDIDQIILGKPEGKMGAMVETAAAALRKAGLNVILADETLSTQQAKRLMIEMGIRQKKRREDNAFSAVIILQNYLDEHE